MWHMHHSGHSSDAQFILDSTSSHDAIYMTLIVTGTIRLPPTIVKLYSVWWIYIFLPPVTVVLFIGDVIVAWHVLYTRSLNITTMVWHNTKYCTVHTFTMQLDVCFPSSGRAFIEWNRQNSEATQCACVDIAIQFNSRCSTSVPLNTALLSVATGCGDYWGKRYTHCKAITMYVPCLIFLEHWPNSVCWGKHCPFICVLCLPVRMWIQMNPHPPFSLR